MNSKDQRMTKNENPRSSFTRPRKNEIIGSSHSIGLLGKTTLIIVLIAAWIGGLAHISTSEPETLDVNEKFVN